MQILKAYSETLKTYFEQILVTKDPVTLYEPISYIMSLGAKRIRPLMLLHTHKIFGGDVKSVLPLAAAVEVFHNFTLMHDDIMDNARMRRGHATVHEKYDVNTAILSGDLMLIQSYGLISKCSDSPAYTDIMTTFNEMSVQLCEGQQLDVDFESRDNVEIDEYIHMITYKTSVLIAAAMKMAAQHAGASQEDQEHIYQFGKNIGIAFQMQDDILDSFGEKAAVGKRIGGDILEGKKTYLYIKALELSDDSQKTKLISLMNDPHIEDQRKIDDVLNIFKATHVRVYADQLKEAYRDLAFSHLAELKINESDRVELKEFGQYLLDRTV